MGSPAGLRATACVFVNGDVSDGMMSGLRGGRRGGADLDEDLAGGERPDGDLLEDGNSGFFDDESLHGGHDEEGVSWRERKRCLTLHLLAPRAPHLHRLRSAIGRDTESVGDRASAQPSAGRKPPLQFEGSLRRVRGEEVLAWGGPEAQAEDKAGDDSPAPPTRGYRREGSISTIPGG